MAIGEKVERDQPGIAAKGLLPPEFIVCRQPAHPVHLVAHLGTADVRGPAQTGVKRMHVSGQCREFRIESIAGGGELALAHDGDRPRTQPLRQFQRVLQALWITSGSETSCLASRPAIAGSTSVADRRGRTGVVRPRMRS